MSRRTLAARRAEIAAKRTKMEPLLPIVEQVKAFEKQNDALQKRIDSKGLIFKVRVVSAQKGTTSI